MSDLGNKQIFSKNLRNIMDERQVTRRQMCSELGFVYSTFSDWYNGKKYPRIDKVEMMANYFGIKKSDLIEERTAAKESDAINCASTGSKAKTFGCDNQMKIISSEDIELLKKFHALDGRGRSVVESVLNAEYEHQQPTLHVVAAANGQRAYFEERDDLPPLLPEDPPDV